jgi:3'-5' exoribonuclease
MAVLDSPELLREWHDGCDVGSQLLVRDVRTQRTRDGSPYLRLTLADRSGTVPAICWESPDDAPVQPGDVLNVRGSFGVHPRYGRQVTIRAFEIAAGDEIAWDRLTNGPRADAGELEAELDALIDSIGDPHLSRLVTDLLGSDSMIGHRYRRAPAAKYNHHAYPHGLLEHSLQAARLVDAAARSVPGIDRDLAVCGALLHDIGKLDAYDGAPMAIDLTDAGKLEGEIPMGYFLVRSTIERLSEFPVELARALLHIILSHHGALEHGSPVVPATRVAVLVAAMDHVSGQLGTFDRLERETEPGGRWSRYDRTLASSAFFGDSGAG